MCICMHVDPGSNPNDRIKKARTAQGSENAPNGGLSFLFSNFFSFYLSLDLSFFLSFFLFSFLLPPTAFLPLAGTTRWKLRTRHASFRSALSARPRSFQEDRRTPGTQEGRSQTTGHAASERKNEKGKEKKKQRTKMRPHGTHADPPPSHEWKHCFNLSARETRMYTYRKLLRTHPCTRSVPFSFRSAPAVAASSG